MADNSIQTVYAQDDFLNGTAPYEYVYKYKDDRFAHTRELEKMCKIAKLVKVGNFKKLYGEYYKSQMQSIGFVDNATDFTDQELELSAGDWTANDLGVSRFTEKGEQIACVHPITISRRLINADSELEKIELAYKKGKGKKSWKKIIVDKKVIASANQIVSLSEYGIAVTSENAKYLVQYLHDIENLNYDEITENNSITRLGWIGKHGFSPYINDLIFDGDSIFKSYYNCVGTHGDRSKWITEAKAARNRHIYNKIILAASFASALIEPSGALPFFVHLWGDTSGSGKTVSMMLGASVWAKPAVGDYSISFKSTVVGHEVYAGFLNSLPLCMDELQVIKDKKDFDEIIYALSEGSGKLRGSRDGGLRANKKWRNCMITTGEKPITSTSSGAGAINRIIDLDCSDKVLFDNGNQSVKIITKNYGHAGKEFVEWLQKDENMNNALSAQSEYEKSLLKDGKTSKQALSASLILAADEVISRLFFDDEPLRTDNLIPLLLTNDEISINKNGWGWLQDWIAENSNKFNNNASDVYGTTETHEDGSKFVFIINNIFSRVCAEEGYTPKSFWNWLVREKKGITDEKGNKILKKINGMPVRCACIKIRDEEEFEIKGTEKPLPF